MGSSQSNKKFKITSCKESGEARAELLRKYKISHGVIGEGAFGKVYKGSCLENSNNKVAIKAFKKKQLYEDDIKSIEAEIKVLSQLDHPNIIKYYESFADEGNMYIVTDFIKGKTLSKLLEEEATAFSEGESAHLLHQLASAIHHCHSKNITHRDVKLENIMVDERMNVTLLDFGLSKTFNKKKLLKSACGTPSFMAPEAMTNNYNEKCDVWSFGVVMYILLTGRLPFRSKTPEKILKEALKCDLKLGRSYWDHISKEAKDLISMVLNPDAQERFSIQEVLEHPWFDIVRDDSTDDSQEGPELRVLETLTNFSFENKFTKACMRLIASFTKIPSDSAIRQEFNRIDEKRNAIISKEELRNAFDKNDLIYTDKELKTIIGDLNFSGEEYINYTEFCTATMNKSDILNSKNCKSLFSLFDSDKDGVISGKDIMMGLEKSGIFTKSLIKAIIKDSGIKKSQTLGCEEFEDILSS